MFTTKFMLGILLQLLAVPISQINSQKTYSCGSNIPYDLREFEFVSPNYPKSIGNESFSCNLRINHRWAKNKMQWHFLNVIFMTKSSGVFRSYFFVWNTVLHNVIKWNLAFHSCISNTTRWHGQDDWLFSGAGLISILYGLVGLLTLRCQQHSEHQWYGTSPFRGGHPSKYWLSSLLLLLTSVFGWELVL